MVVTPEEVPPTFPALAVDENVFFWILHPKKYFFLVKYFLPMANNGEKWNI